MRARLNARAQEGMTLVELVVAIGIISLVGGIFVTVLGSATRKTRPIQLQAQTVDELRTSIAAIARELRSAECVSLPVANTGASNQLRFTTHYGGGPSSYEVTYTAQNGQLLRQKTGVGTVRMVTSSLVDTADAFTHLATPRRTVRIEFHVQTAADQQVRDLSTTVAGRNAWKAC